MDFDVTSRTIYLCRHGSHAYGLATPESDLDLKGVCIAPREYHFGFMKNFEQHEAMAHNGHPEDKVIFCVKKFFRLAAECNPNIIEVLFCDDSDIIRIDDFGEWLRDIRESFISKKARFTFSGYAHAQLKRIKTHRNWLLDPPKCPPDRKDFGLSAERSVSKSDLGAFQALETKVAEGNEEVMAEMSNLPKDVVRLLVQEKAYAAAKLHWEQYQNWVKTRNPKRAALEAKFGYDVKHGSHLCRLMRMCKEILEGKGVLVKRPDRDEILAIKNGQMPYDQLIEEAERLDRECDELYKTSTLQKEPDRKFLDEQCVKMVEEYVGDFG